ncbi:MULTISPECIES: ABC transporter ATP-binding protein [Agrobacterium]|uniref:Spermidine/putrescine import ATP-binding protein PotA n=1 Tax=Agrobacterium tumefaciens TaxID=358 RepID=A0AAE6BH39_AGRTU|nr:MULTISPECIES: ABC transporter ATP-binding protein [Agrobacterium]QCL77104.1 ABC transporter ATP-binding protein [Agrobacterium tumefaciens]QCL82613.1 ABC transporter ATP-binding protein [Agrobacterium tumefaciens]CUX70136.1 putative sperimidine/putrescine transport protein (ABC superfamily, atp_bind) [Agrobacterium sp. NCPPB 925]
MSAETLVLTGVQKAYAATVAVRDLDLRVAAGELVALLGPSGCGKTTTLRMVAGFEHPDAGSITIGGNEISALPPHRRNLGMVFQNYSLFPHRTVAENIGFGLKMAGLARAEKDRRVAEMLDLIQLPGRKDMYPAQLSGGQQQRVALGRSLVVNPKVLLLDEPLGALDKSLRESMQFEIRSMQQRLGITTLLVTHDQEEALSMSDRVAVMNAGRILQIGSPTDIYDRPQSRFVAEFLGTSNIFEGKVSADGRFLIVAGNGGDRPIALEAPATPGRSLTLSVRPERLRLGDEATSCTNFEGRVTGAVFRGNYAAYQVAVPALGRDLFVYRQADGPLGTVSFRLGETLTLGWVPQDAVPVRDE